MSVDRQCSSGLMAIATAAKTIVCDGVDIMVGGGLESISLVQNEHQNRHRAADPNVLKIKPEVYLPMIDTAEIVSKRYKISREAQDEYSYQRQMRTAAAQREGKLDAEIAPIKTTKAIVNKETKAVSYKEVTLAKDEGNRADTTLAGLASLKPVRGEGNFITAGNASQLSDGASACVLMERSLAEQARHRAARRLPRHGGRRLRAGRDGHRPGVRDSAPAQAQRPEGRRHRPLGAERSLRRPGASTAATSWASPATASTSTAARSRSATPTA